MLGFVIRRLLALIPLLLIVSFLVYALVLLVPGDPARNLLGLRATPAQVDAKRHELGLDKPFVSQYGSWLDHAAQGDLGDSWFRNSHVASEISERFPVTFSMALGAIVLTILLGIPAGLLAGTRPGSIWDRIVSVGSSAGIAVPDFWLAITLVIVFAVQLHVLPAIGYVPFSESPVDWATHLYLPWLALGLPGAAAIARQMRGAIIDALEQDYVRTAAAKGLRGRSIVLKHALKNAAIAPVTVIGLTFAYMLGGTVILENIFSINGIGDYFYRALSAQDIPVIQGCILVFALVFLACNLIVDILYGYLNPRVRVA